MATRAWGSGALLTTALLVAGGVMATADESADPFGGSAGQDPFAGNGEDPFASEGQDPFGSGAGDPFGPGELQDQRQQEFRDRQREMQREQQHLQEQERRREVVPRQRDAQPDADPHRQQVYWAEPHSDSSNRIRRALDRRLSSSGLDFLDTPLEEVVDFLRNEYEIGIQLDETALDDLGIGTDEHVTVNLRNISLKSALRLMLKQLELTYVVADEVLLITTEDEAETRLTVGIYPVSDVASDKNSLSELAEVITSAIVPETWAINKGGDAELKPLAAGFLVISQTRAVHEELIEFLSALRRAKAAANSSQDPGPVGF
ncbi:hypothetical protein KOR34_29830 [Posidoniimonas corsicana]|uniref:Uncharacterized protein n=1 Tax=Posidoniimonas corsicana TaxID=1938618 RepID=A0A5C5VHG6_9BACT|nr:STN domain-containing protein [Posidoniimonas corsicana]TWT38016.1 hypothetical protein KOR34_29830 [Posidoniimonas corsicana]